MPKNYKNREVFEKIIRFLEIPEIIVIHGSRQVGKTTLIKMTIDYLKNKDIKDIFYFDLEKNEYLELCNKGPDAVIQYIKTKAAEFNQHKPKQKIFLFIDEIQYLDNPSGFLKLFFDHYKEQFKIVVSGSSSFAIKSKFKDSLVGRIIDLEIFGLSFREFLNFKDLTYDLKTDSQLAHQELKELYREYILYGAYPKVVLVKNLELKELYINNIIEKYIFKDIKDLAGIKHIKKFNNLLKFLASQAGQLVNINELSDTLGISRPTIEEYLFILENTYIIKLVPPFYKNIRSELTKMPKIYFEDLGILNILQNKKLISEFNGSFFENACFTYLRREFKAQDIHFWRTQAKQEVDFVIDNKHLIPLEAKISYNDRLVKNLLYFGRKYNIKNLYCITFEKKPQARYKNIKQIYPWEIKPLDTF